MRCRIDFKNAASDRIAVVTAHLGCLLWQHFELRVASQRVCALVRSLYEWLPQSLGSWLVIMLAFVIVIGKTGFWPMPNLGAQFTVSQNLTHNPFPNPDGHYIFTNYLQPALFYILGGCKLVSYAIYASAITVAFFLLFLLWFIKFHGKGVALDQFKVLGAVTFPVFMVPFYWIGMDGMALLLMLVVMIRFSSRWAIVLGAVLAWQHFEQGIAAFALLAGTLIVHFLLFRNTASAIALKKTALVVLGLILGRILLFGWFHIAGIELSGDRLTLVQKYFDTFVAQWKTGWLYIVWSLLGVGWLVVISKIRHLWPLCVAAVFVFGFVAVTGDQTRIGSIILFPTLFYWVMMDKELWKELDLKWVMVPIVLYLILPVVYVWGGYPYGSLWKHDIVIIKQMIDGGFRASPFDWIRPFRR